MICCSNSTSLKLLKKSRSVEILHAGTCQPVRVGDDARAVRAVATITCSFRDLSIWNESLLQVFGVD